MRKIKKQSALIIFAKFLLALVLLMPFSVYAQTPSLQVEGLAITPFIIEIDATPGVTETRKIQLTNTTNEPLPFEASINDFVPNGTTGQPLFLKTNEDADPKFSLSSWVKITKQPEFNISPKANTVIEFTITPPADVEPGTHYGGILFGRPAGVVDQQGSSVQHRAGAIIIVKLGKSQEKIEIESFAAGKSIFQRETINFSTLLKNYGNVHSKPKGEITIRNIINSPLAQIPINRDANIVLPESTREFSSEWKPKLAFGRYTAEAVLYTATPNWNYGSQYRFGCCP
jgi:hypothetical protein